MGPIHIRIPSEQDLRPVAFPMTFVSMGLFMVSGYVTTIGWCGRAWEYPRVNVLEIVVRWLDDTYGSPMVTERSVCPPLVHTPFLTRHNAVWAVCHVWVSPTVPSPHRPNGEKSPLDGFILYLSSHQDIPPNDSVHFCNATDIYNVGLSPRYICDRQCGITTLASTDEKSGNETSTGLRLAVFNVAHVHLTHRVVSGS